MWQEHYTLNDHEQKLLDMSDSEFDQYMMSNYQEMFINRYTKKDQTIIHTMNFGFEIGPGWRHVLDSLCRKLKVIQDNFGIICVFDQVKEKFGTARFYYHCEDSEASVKVKDEEHKDEEHKEVLKIISVLVNHYESYTDYVCEELGTNIDPKLKISVGSWCYGMGIEGFKKWVVNDWCKGMPEERIIEMIKTGEASHNRAELLQETRDYLMYLKPDKLVEINQKLKEEINNNKSNIKG